LGWHTRSGDKAMFTNIHEPGDILRVVARMRDVAEHVGRKGGMKTLVIGMPNTGKSSMLNVIRRHATDRKRCTHAQFR
jgi:ribosome biogenesis GTPase A